jgi:hypothetical protein
MLLRVPCVRRATRFFLRKRNTSRTGKAEAGGGTTTKLPRLLAADVYQKTPPITAAAAIGCSGKFPLPECSPPLASPIPPRACGGIVDHKGRGHSS